MQNADFGKNLNLPSKGGLYIRLKEKGDKVKFLISGTPTYETIHWVGDKEKVLCAKYNSDNPEKAECDICEKYRMAVENNDEAEQKANRPVTNFYYPILDLNSNKPSIFQFSAKSIHYTIKNYADEGLDVFNTVWVVERTNEQGANYYKVLNMGVPKLSGEQEEQFEIAKKLKPANGKPSESIETPEEEGIKLD
jgi:hypothetical protein